MAFEFGRHLQDLVGAAADRSTALNDRESRRSHAHGAAEPETTGHRDVAVHPDGPCAAEAFEGGATRMVFVELLGAVRGSARADISVELDRHAEHVEPGAQVR